MFLRRRYYYDPDDPYGCAGCFGWIVALLAVLAAIVLAVIYIGAYILLGFVILGAAFGVLVSVFALIKSIPQAVSDTSCMYTGGNLFSSTVLRALYFIKQLVVYTVKSEIDFARDAFTRSSAYKVISFRKWLHIATGSAVIVCGLVVVVGVLAMFACLIFGAAMAIFALILALAALSLVFMLVFDIFISVKEYFTAFADNSVFGSFVFGGWAELADIGRIPAGYFSSAKDMIRDAWSNSLDVTSNAKQSSAYDPIPKRILTFVAWLTMPLACALTIIVITIPMFVLAWVPAYLANIVWILINSVIGLIKR